MNKNDVVMLGISIARIKGEADEELQNLEKWAQAEDYAVHELEIARHEARGYAAGLEAALELIHKKLEQAA